MLKVDDKSTLSTGAGIGAHYTYGIDDQFNFMAELNASIVAADQKQDTPTSPHTRPAEVDHALAGVGYVIDVLRWVPYFGVLAGGYRLSGGTLDNAQLVFGAAVQRRARLPALATLGDRRRRAAALPAHEDEHVPVLHDGHAALRIHVGLLSDLRDERIERDPASRPCRRR